MKKLRFKNALSAKLAIVSKHLTGLSMLFYLTVIAISLSACSKDKGGGPETPGDYYFRASVDGRKVEFHTANFQGSGNDGRFEHIVVGGYETSYPASGGPPPRRWTLRSGG